MSSRTRNVRVTVPTPRFEIRSAHVRYNLADEDAHAVHVVADETRICGILTLLGWNPENARIESCHFERDETLHPGTMLITPRGDL